MSKLAIIRYDKAPKHEHFFKYDKDSKTWKFLICELEGQYSCTGNRGSLPRGTKFDIHRDSKSFYDRYPEL
jgi:hypothetical protein